MEFTGIIIRELPERGGVSAKGVEWKCASYVIETTDQYPKRMCFEVFGADRIEKFAIKQGETLTVSFDIDARESNGRWFNSIRAWKVDRVAGNGQGQAPAQAQPAEAPNIPPLGTPDPNVAPPFNADQTENLPF